MAAPGNRPEESASQFRLITAVPRPRELTGAVDLLSHYGLRDQYEAFCRKPLPLSIGESHYLKNVVGETEIRKGEGMELGQLLGAGMETLNVHIQPFDVDVLHQAFSLKESGSISLPEADRGIPTMSGRVKEELKDKDKKHKKHKKHKDRHKEREKDKDKDKHKEREKDKDKDKEKEKDHEKDRDKKRENGEDRSKKHHKKKRKHDGDDEEGEGHKHKKKKHKHSSKTEMPELKKNRG